MYSGLAELSAIIPNSVGPASISIPVLSLTDDFANVTNAPPGPTILSTFEIDFEKSGGIVPVIVQDANTKDVLTLAYSNKESLELAKKTGKSWFWSRSRNKLWMKGEELSLIHI